MKKLEDARYPQSVQLFKFCKQVLDHKYGGVRIIDQDVGQILGYDPADCSHWKNGKKHVKSIIAIKKIAQHLGVDERLVEDVAHGDLNHEEGFFEINGYGETSLDQKFFEAFKKESLKRNSFSWTKEKELELRDHYEKILAETTSIVDNLHKKISFEQAPLYFQEISAQIKELQFVPVSDPEAPVRFETKDNVTMIEYPRSRESRPFIRYQLSRACAQHFLKESLQKTLIQFGEMGQKINEILINHFATQLMVPTSLIKKELLQLTDNRDIISQLSEVFWVSKMFMNRRLREILVA